MKLSIFGKKFLACGVMTLFGFVLYSLSKDIGIVYWVIGGTISFMDLLYEMNGLEGVVPRTHVLWWYVVTPVIALPLMLLVFFALFFDFGEA